MDLDGWENWVDQGVAGEEKNNNPSIVYENKFYFCLFVFVLKYNFFIDYLGN